MELLKAIEMRKSTRSYKPEQISDESLDTILKAGYAAPVGMNDYNSVHITVVQNSNLLDKLTDATKDFFENTRINTFYGAPTVAIVSGKPSEKAPGVEAHNAACIVENMSLAATDLGLGSVYLMGFLFAISNNKELLAELNLPEGFVPVAALAIGYSTEDLTEEDSTKHTIETNIIK
ncbi:nitroreductase family protein [Clostridium sp. SHJSY1]|uniref:nitroreductase family protein n=1 Tax=Clostridium sp. SHJSY1 TaxID=2942483 RepID=UPI0028762716|nr:nitroreductase family protein [Clostridium sp. SHJSY1]MDS0526154.1 nitroreductase family protein [Clostridium sp. SHJSY1]